MATQPLAGVKKKAAQEPEGEATMGAEVPEMWKHLSEGFGLSHTTGGRDLSQVFSYLRGAEKP